MEREPRNTIEEGPEARATSLAFAFNEEGKLASENRGRLLEGKNKKVADKLTFWLVASALAFSASAALVKNEAGAAGFGIREILIGAQVAKGVGDIRSTRERFDFETTQAIKQIDDVERSVEGELRRYVESVNANALMTQEQKAVNIQAEQARVAKLKAGYEAQRNYIRQENERRKMQVTVDGGMNGVRILSGGRY